MCLGVPGEVLSIASDELRMGRISFGGVVKEVSLVYVPEAAVGDYVIVHAGFAIGSVDAAAATRVFAYLDALGEVPPEEPQR